MLPTKFRFIWPNGFREESKNSANQKQESPVAAMFIMDRDGMSNLYREPSIADSYQVSDHLAKWFQRKRFLKNRSNQKQELPMAVMFVNGSGRN